jgi:hypothetical protein
MALLTAPYDSPTRNGDIVAIPVEANTQIFAGGLVARNAAGNAVPAQDAAGLKVVGRCEEQVANISADWNQYQYGAAGAVRVQVRRGVFRYDNAADDPVTASDIGALGYAEDDHTISRSGGNNKVIAGRIIDIDSSGVWIDTRDHAAVIN